ncbi:helix-turn-helix domain-containing protein [Arthrobacter alpinus]|uniref:TetR/AcrR family transcriptional regulator n=1 Tax=Arthrobacter alpinus TaxID=656366 RepID=UPI0009EA471C
MDALQDKRQVRQQDRRHVRRQETIEEILAAAVDLMARDGVAGMSLSAVARAVGMKPPSIYEYSRQNQRFTTPFCPRRRAAPGHGCRRQQSGAS